MKVTPLERFRHILGAAPILGSQLNERETGFLVDLSERFEEDWFTCASIEDASVSAAVRERFKVEPEVRNRRLRDKRVLGSRLIPNGYLTVDNVTLSFRLTDIGRLTAIEAVRAL